MKISKNYTNKFAVRGALLLLGLILFIFYLYPPLLLFIRGRDVMAEGFYFKPELAAAFLNSIKISMGVFLSTTAIGGFLAWLVVKTDFRFKKLIDHLTILSFALPPYIIALSWLQVFGRNGYLERILKNLFNVPPLQSQPYSLTAVVVVMSLHLYPLMFMSIRNALEKLDPTYEQAALLSGASGFQMFLTVTLPMILPNLLSTGLLVFSRTMANFAVPALLCLPIGVEVVPTSIYSALSSLQIDKAAGLSMLLVLFSTSLHVLHWFMLRRSRISASAGTGGMRTFKLGRKAILSTAVFGLIMFVCLIPLASMFVSSFMLRWGLPMKAEYFTIGNYAQIFSPGSHAARAFRNSFVFGASAALLASIVGTGAALAGNYIKSKAGLVFDAAASWPMAIPNTVLAVSAIFAWNRRPLNLYGTPWAIIVTYMVLFTPIIMKQVTGLLTVLDQKLIKAARTAGASGATSFFTVALPILAPGYKAGILLCLMISLREIPISLLLYSAGQETVGVLLFGMQSQSYGLEMTSALAMVLIVIILLVNRLLNSGRKMNE